MKKRLWILVAAAMAAVAVWLSASQDALAQNNDLPEFGQVRAAVPACVNSVPGPARGSATCAQWSALASCIVQNAASSNTCSTDMVSGARALAAMQATCDASHNAEVAGLRAQLASCGSPAASGATAPRHRIVIPRCIGSAVLVCHTRGAARNEWLQGQDTCSRAVARLDRAGCACPSVVNAAGAPVAVPAIRVSYNNGREASRTSMCPGDFIAPQVRAQVERTEAVDATGLAALRARLDRICRLPTFVTSPSGVVTINPAAPAAPANDLAPAEAANALVTHDCAVFNARMIQLLLAASNGTAPVDLGAANTRLNQLEARVVILERGHENHETRLTEAERNIQALQRNRTSGWHLSLSTGVSGGWTSLSDLGGASVFWETAVHGRYWLNHRVALQASAAVIFGALGAPGINNVGGYAAQAGVSFHLMPSESISLVLDVGAYLRTYALTGFESVGNLADARMVGDYAGRTGGGRVGATVLFGDGLIGLTLSLAVGYGENVYTTPFRDTVNVQTGDGMEVLPGAFLTIGLGRPPAPPAPSSEPAAATPTPAPAPAVTSVAPAATPPANDNAAAPAPVARLAPPPAALPSNVRVDENLAAAAGF